MADERRARTLEGLITSLLVHAVGLLLLVTILDRSRQPGHDNAPLPMTDRVVWTVTTGAGGGGGGGGSRQPEAPQVAERPGEDERSAPVASAPAPRPADPAPTHDRRLVIPAIATAAGLDDVPGVLTAIPAPVPGSRGPGSGPGAGSGDRFGTGPGHGDGLGDGFIAGTGGDVYEPGADVSMPRLIHDPRPGYTQDAVHARIQGVVVMDAVVQPDGTVGSVQVIRSLDRRFGLDDEAVRTVRRWRFVPGQRRNQPVAVRVTIELAFTLR